jgi:hypothetical protein
VVQRKSEKPKKQKLSRKQAEFYNELAKRYDVRKTKKRGKK